MLKSCERDGFCPRHKRERRSPAESHRSACKLPHHPGGARLRDICPPEHDGLPRYRHQKRRSLTASRVEPRMLSFASAPVKGCRGVFIAAISAEMADAPSVRAHQRRNQFPSSRQEPPVGGCASKQRCGASLVPPPASRRGRGFDTTSTSGNNHNKNIERMF